MAVAFGSATNIVEQTTVDTTYTAPSGITNGDLLLIWHFEFLATTPPTPTAPAGFTLVPGTWPLVGTTQQSTWLWYKIASGESGNYTVSHASCVNRGIMIRVTGADTTTPFSPSPTLNKGTTGTTSTFTGLTTTVDNCLIMAVGADDNDTAANLTAPTGTTPTFTERVDDLHGEYLATGNLSPAGATGNKTMTNNSASGQPWYAVLVSVQPATTAAALAVMTPSFQAIPLMGGL